MFVTRHALNVRHPTMEIFRNGEDRKRRCLAEEKAREGANRDLTTYG